MNYTEIYNRLIARGKKRRTKNPVWGAWHKHHVIPRHMGGTDDASNFSKLQVKEHYIAHLLLYKLYGRKQDYIAYRALRGNIKDLWEIPEYREFMRPKLLANLSKVDRALAYKRAGEAAKKIIHLTIQSPEGHAAAIAASVRWTKANPEKAAAKATAMHTETARVNMSRAKSKYIIVSPDGVEYLSTRDAAKATGNKLKSITNWTIRNHYGWSRRLKV